MTPTNTEALAAELEFHGRLGSETEQQAAARRVKRNAMAAAELRRLSAVEAENQSIREALAAKVTTETLLTGAHGKPGEFFIGLQGGAAQLLAEGLAQQFKDSDATNYLELRFTSRFAAMDTDFVVTVQKVTGKTPATLRKEAEAERDALVAERDTLQVGIELMQDNAARYCWLRDNEDGDYGICVWDSEDGWARDARPPSVVDAAIDAAMKDHP